MGRADAFPGKVRRITRTVPKKLNVVTMTEEQTDNDTDWESNPKTNSKGFVKSDSWPECPRCGYTGCPVVSDAEGLSTLHCKECNRTLQHATSVTRYTDESELKYCAMGDHAWGIGDEKSKAVENMKEHLGDDASNRFILYVSDGDINVYQDGSVKAEDGEFLHRIGWRDAERY